MRQLKQCECIVFERVVRNGNDYQNKPLHCDDDIIKTDDAPVQDLLPQWLILPHHVKRPQEWLMSVSKWLSNLGHASIATAMDYDMSQGYILDILDTSKSFPFCIGAHPLLTFIGRIWGLE